MRVPQYVIANQGCRNAREWKSKKRKQARAAKKAIGSLMAGGAYFPSGHFDVDIAAKAIDRIIDDISVKNFGR